MALPGRSSLRATARGLALGWLWAQAGIFISHLSSIRTLILQRGLCAYSVDMSYLRRRLVIQCGLVSRRELVLQRGLISRRELILQRGLASRRELIMQRGLVLQRRACPATRASVMALPGRSSLRATARGLALGWPFRRRQGFVSHTCPVDARTRV